MKVYRWVKIWLYVGIAMLLVQIVVGGITRLTGSGLSITKWEIVTGVIPPITHEAWLVEFEKYKQTPQYAKINAGMMLGEFKFIYFWEFIHRFWARTMGIVFLVPFLFFSFKGWITRSLRKDLGVVFGLAVLAAMFGWIMVASGLINRPWVNAYKLSFHLIIGISVFAYLLWTTLKYAHISKENRNIAVPNGQMTWLITILVIVVIQIIFGGWMSGMKAALFYPTWPLIGDNVLPPEVFISSNWSVYNFTHYEEQSFVVSLIHTLHRNTAYILFALIIWYGWRFEQYKWRSLTSRWFVILVLVLCLQVALGIITLLTSIGSVSVLWGVLHQGVAVLLLACLIVHIHFLKTTSNLFH